MCGLSDNATLGIFVQTLRPMPAHPHSVGGFKKNASAPAFREWVGEADYTTFNFPTKKERCMDKTITGKEIKRLLNDKSQNF